MNRKTVRPRTNPGGMLVLVLLAATVPASAETVLRFSPHDGTVNLDDTASLSVYIDDAVALRTFEVFVRYDAEILTSTRGDHGQLFTDAGAYIFENWTETSPGYWHGYAIVMDALHWTVGPGELYVWTFTADRGGFCPVTVDSVVLYAPDASLMPEVSLPPTSVRVFDPAMSSIAEPSAALAPLTLSPNPFNPGASLILNVERVGPARVDVYDCRGRHVTTAWSGWSDGRPLHLSWDGRDRNGGPLASGVYLFLMEGPRGDCGVARGMLVK